MRDNQFKIICFISSNECIVSLKTRRAYILKLHTEWQVLVGQLEMLRSQSTLTSVDSFHCLSMKIHSKWTICVKHSSKVFPNLRYKPIFSNLNKFRGLKGVWLKIPFHLGRFKKFLCIGGKLLPVWADIALKQNDYDEIQKKINIAMDAIDFNASKMAMIS